MGFLNFFYNFSYLNVRIGNNSKRNGATEFFIFTALALSFKRGEANLAVAKALLSHDL